LGGGVFVGVGIVVLLVSPTPTKEPSSARRLRSCGWVLAARTNCEFGLGAPSAGGPARIWKGNRTF